MPVLYLCCGCAVTVLCMIEWVAVSSTTRPDRLCLCCACAVTVTVTVLCMIEWVAVPSTTHPDRLCLFRLPCTTL